jgi:hypothetical protein
MLARYRVLVTAMCMLSRNQLVTVQELLATVDWSRLSHQMDPMARGGRAVVMAIEAGERAAAVGAIVQRPKFYGGKQQLRLDHHRAA